MDIPADTLQRLRHLRERLDPLQSRYNLILATLCDASDIELQNAEVDLEAGVIKTPDSDA